MQKNFFRLTMLSILATAVMVMVTPALTLNSLLYPVKIDSAYVAQEEMVYQEQLAKGKADSGLYYFFSPEELDLKSNPVHFYTSDSTLLRGWISFDTKKNIAPLLLIIPDVGQGAIQYLLLMQQFTERGFHVCVIDMRGQGLSGGSPYHFGKSALDVIALIDDLKRQPEVGRAAILGIGTGAGIALCALSASPFVADALVLQNPVTSLNKLIQRQSATEWGWWIHLFMPSLIRAYEQKTGINTSEFNFASIIERMSIPQMYVAANHFTNLTAEETVLLYHQSTFYRKRLYIDRDSWQKPAGQGNSKAYFDRISAFINSSLPTPIKRTRFRKLV